MCIRDRNHLGEKFKETIAEAMKTGDFRALNTLVKMCIRDRVMAHREAPGTILTVNKDSFEVAASEGGLKVMELQLEGKKRMTAHDFLLGVKVQPGDCLLYTSRCV